MRVRAAVAAASLAAVATACGSSAPKVAAPLPTAPEPAVSPPAQAQLPGAVVPLAGAPEGIAITAGGVVAVNVRGPAGLAIRPKGQAGATIVVPTAGEARHLTLAGPDGPALVPQEPTDHLVEVALPGGTQVASGGVGRQPHEAFAAAGSIVWVANEFGNSASLVKGGTVVRTVPVPLQPGGGAPSGDGRYVDVVGVRARRLSEFTPTGTLVGTVNCGAGPTHTVSGDGDLVWVNDTSGDEVLGFALTPTGPKQVATIPTGKGSRPYGDAYDPLTHTLWVTLTGTDTLLGLTLKGAAVQRRVSFATVRQPNSVALDHATGQVVVTGSTTDGALQFIDPPGGV